MWRTQQKTPNITHFSRFVAEIFDGVGINWWCSVIRVGLPRQPNRRLRDVRNYRFRWRTRKSWRLWSAMEYNGRIGRWFDNECRTPWRLSGLTYGFTHVHPRVQLTEVWRGKSITSSLSQSTDVRLINKTMEKTSQKLTRRTVINHISKEKMFSLFSHSFHKWILKTMPVMREIWFKDR